MSLKDLPNMTAQQVFDAIATHLLTQMERPSQCNRAASVRLRGTAPAHPDEAGSPGRRRAGTASGVAGAAVVNMTKQQLRAAVAEYDAEMVDAIIVPDEDGYMIEWHGDTPVTWYVFDGLIRRDEGCYSQESEVLISHAATMRAMDAAAKAFKEALK